MIGLLWSDGLASEWLRSFCEENSIKLEAAYAHRRISAQQLPDVVANASKDYPPLGDRDPESRSARTMMQAATDIAKTTEGTDELSARHVIAAYIFRNPPGHDAQLKSWGFDRNKWVASFRRFLEDFFPEQATKWHDILGVTETATLIGSFECDEQLKQAMQHAVKDATTALTPEDLLYAILLAGVRQTDPDDDGKDLVSVVAPSSDQQSELSADLRARGAGPIQAETTLTREAKSVMETALDLSRAISESDEIGTRHLIAALVLSDDTAVETNLKRYDARPTEIRDTLYRKFISRWTNDDLGHWHFHLIGVTPPIVSRYDSDLAKGTDRLGVTRFATAFAAVIAHPDTKPPLAVGVFGDWGSGKSFFMQLIENQTARIVELPQEPRIFCRKIAAIWFNAWHYAEANLLASLVHTIFTGLHKSMGGETGGNEELERILDSLEVAQTSARELREEVAEAKTRQDQCAEQVELARSHYEQAQSGRLDLDAALRKIRVDLLKGVEWNDAPEVLEKHLGMTGLKGRLKDASLPVEEIRKLVAEVIAVAEQTRSAWIWLSRASIPWPLVGLIVAVLVIGMVVAFQLQHVGSWPAVAAAVTEFTAIVGVATGWVRRVTGKVAAGLNVFSGVRSRIDDLLVTEREAVREAQVALEAAKTALEQKQAAHAAAEREVAQVQRELKEWTPSRRIARLIEERLEGKDYEEYLGLVTAVRRDFIKLSSLLSEVAGDVLSETTPPDRVVLYIDDRDRCPSDQVVRVLETIHLLLNTDLFVVVVGVDVRWAAQSLHEKYANHLMAGTFESRSERNAAVSANHPKLERASALDYLEKIFQIPFWLPPMEEEASRTMIGSLVPRIREVETAGDALTSETEEPHPTPAPQQPTDESSPAQPQPNGGSQADAVLSLEILEEERNFMLSLAGAVGKSPRRLKRFVNTYRILKASCNALERAEFVLDGGKSGQYLAAMTLLAIVTGAPGSVLELLNTLRDASRGTLTGQRARLEEAASAEEQQYVKEAFDAYLGWEGNANATVDDFRYWAPRVARFSFRSGRW